MIYMFWCLYKEMLTYKSFYEVIEDSLIVKNDVLNAPVKENPLWPCSNFLKKYIVNKR